MSESIDYGVPFVNSVFHPTDFTADSAFAFAHALGLALRRQTELTIMHATKSEGEEDWSMFPPVRSTLTKWGMLDPGSPRSAVFEDLKLRIRKVSVLGRTPLAAITEYLGKKPTDLIVLATEARESSPRWLSRSLAEDLATMTSTMTLFVPDTARGLISLSTGEMSLRRVLIPVDRRPDPRAALVYASRAARMMERDGVELVLLHVGEPGSMPPLLLPDAPGSRWLREEREGDPVDVISGFAVENEVDLIIMATEGRHGILDALRGTVTEQVLRRSPCPLLAVPWGREGARR